MSARLRSLVTGPVVVALCGPGLLTLMVACSETRTPHNRGQDLFLGKEPLKAAIRGHQTALPPEVVRCINCHGAGSQGATDAAIGQQRVDRSWLVEFRERRGGPPSIYNVRAFCELLRTGVDPAHILIARDMPIYDLEDAACASLWQFLTDETTRHAKHQR